MQSFPAAWLGVISASACGVGAAQVAHYCPGALLQLDTQLSHIRHWHSGLRPPPCKCISEKTRRQLLFIHRAGVAGVQQYQFLP